MRIGINCFHLQPDIGGIKQYFISLFLHLRRVHHEHEFLFFFFEHNKQELSKVVPLDDGGAILLSNQGEVWQYIERMDVYFCPFGSLLPRPLPVPTVVTLVDIQEVFFPHFFTRRHLLARCFHYRGSTAMADQVITISQYSKDTIVKHHRVSPQKVVISHLCADDRFYNANCTGRTIELDLPDSYIFYPANHWEHKNHDVLLRALALLRKEKDVVINVVLTGYEQEGGYPLQQKVREYDLADQVYIVGYVSVEELVFLYSHAQFMVFPSFFEGFGIPLVEAMASGCPVLSANTSSLPEVGLDNVCYFDPSSPEDLAGKIGELHADEEKRAELKARGLIRADEFSVEKMAETHLHAFQKAIKRYSYVRYVGHRFFYKYFLALVFLMRAMWITCFSPHKKS